MIRPKRILPFITLRDNPTARPDIKSFVRGVIWNDNPERELFNEVSNNSLSYGLGADWFSKFALGYLSGDADKPELIRRSQLGDLQWLHGMASKRGELPADIKKIVLRWMQTMYKLATSATNAGTPIQNHMDAGLVQRPGSLHISRHAAHART